MRLTLTCMFLLTGLFAHGQTIPDKIHEKLYGLKKDEAIHAAVQLADSSIVLAGYTNSKGYGNEDAWVLRVSKDARILWERTFGGRKTDVATSIVLASDSNLIATGYTESRGNGEKDQYVMKIDLEGAMLWSKNYGGSGPDRVFDALADKDGGAVITGYETINRSSNVFLASINKYGKINWKKYFGGRGMQAGFALAPLPEGGYLIAGAKSAGQGNKSQNWLIKTDARGIKTWDKLFGNSNSLSRITSLHIANDESVYLAGNNILSAGRRVLNKNWVARYTLSGEKKWLKAFQQHKDTKMNKLLPLPDSSLMMTSLSKQGYSLIGKISMQGDVKWRTSYGRPEEDRILSANLLKNGRLLLTGYNESKSGGNRKDGWAIIIEDKTVLKAFKAQKAPKKETEEEKPAKTAAKEPETDTTKAEKKKYIDVSLKPPKDAFTLVKEYVEKNIKEWARRGEFESSEAYQKRVSLEKRKAKEEELSQEALNKYGSNMLPLTHAKLVKDSYNPDTETYLIRLKDSENFRVHVPREEARQFRDNWDNHEFTRVDYGFLDKKLVVARADAVVNYRTYRFNAKEDASYGDQMTTKVYSSETRSMFPTNYSAAVRYVKKGMDKFMKRGEFETSEAYEKRTSEENIRKKEIALTREALKMKASQDIEISRAALGRYNPDKQYFPINIPGTKTLKLPVPIEEGRMFKNHWDFFQFRNISYGLHDGNYVFDTLQVIVNDSVYNYDARKHSGYGSEMITHIDLDNIDYSRLDDKTYAMFFEGERPTEKPRLFITNISLKDEDQNNILNATENAHLALTIRNNGQGKAYKTRLQVQEQNRMRGIDFASEVEIGNIEAMSKKVIELPLKASDALMAGQAAFEFQIDEMRGFDSNAKKYKLQTAEFKEPFLVATEPYFSTEKGGQIKLGESVYLKMLVENQGEGTAKEVSVQFLKPDQVVNAGKHQFDLGLIGAGESKAVNYEFIPKRTFSENEIPVEIIITEKYDKYGNATTAKASMSKSLMPYTRYNLVADVDKNIPSLDTVYRNRYAIIIGNEDYQSYQEIGSEANVDYAAADAIVFKRYAHNVLGIPEENINFEVNARKHEMQRAFNQIIELAETSRDSSEIFFFYAGHGFPDEATKEAYIMPVNITGAEVREAIKLGDLYTKFSRAENIHRITGFIDACFSGGGRAEGLLAARGIRVKPKEAQLQEGNIVVFSASSGDQVSLPYQEKNHGMFTYAILRKMQETSGDITYGELKNYLKNYVQEQSRRVNNKDQSPSINVSPSVQGIYREWKLNR